MNERTYTQSDNFNMTLSREEVATILTALIELYDGRVESDPLWRRLIDKYERRG